MIDQPPAVVSSGRVPRSNGGDAPTISKLATTPEAAVSGLADAATLAVGGWGGIGVPDALIAAVAKLPVSKLRLITNNCGMGRDGDVGVLFETDQVRSVIASFPNHPSGAQFRRRLDEGVLDVSITPQGTLAERLRAGGAGLGGFLTPAGVGTPMAAGKDSVVVGGVEYLVEHALHPDMAVIRAHQGDPLGNLRFRYAARGFNPVMAMAARVCVVQVDELVPVGALAPDDIHLPGIFVDHMVITDGDNQ